MVTAVLFKIALSGRKAGLARRYLNGFPRRGREVRGYSFSRVPLSVYIGVREEMSNFCSMFRITCVSPQVMRSTSFLCMELRRFVWFLV